MILRLTTPDGATERFEVAGDSALVGRAPNCDVVVPGEYEFVSKRHLRILRGLVIVDLSTNGVYIDGARIDGGAVLGDRSAQLGQSELTISVEGHADAAAPAPSSQPRQSDEAARLHRQLEEQDQATRAAMKRAEQLQEALEAMSREKAHLLTRLARAEVAAANAKEPEPREVPPPPADASASTKLVFSLQQEIARLKRELEAARASGAGGTKAAAPKPPPRPPVEPQPPADVNPTGRTETAPPWETPRTSGGTPAGPPGPIEAMPPLPTGATSGTSLARLAELVQRDAEAVRGEPAEPLDSYLIVEGYRFLRRVERVVTRLAGGLIQLYQLHTIVPGVEGNLRELLHATLERPTSEMDRQALLDYLTELGKWMVVALGAYRNAAEKFAHHLKDELSAEKLAEKQGISPTKRLSSSAEAKLWRRVCQYLRELSPDSISEKLDGYAREAADELIDASGSDSFS